MSILALVLLLLAALAPGLVLALRKVERDPTVPLAVLAALLLALAAILAAYADPADGWRRGAALVLGVAAATTAGSDVVRATFRVIRGDFLPPRRRHHPRLADQGAEPDGPDVDDASDTADESAISGGSAGTVLRGGAWIGYLERAAISATLLAGWPEGMALVLAVKGVGRYPELTGPASVESHAPETFIIGTLTSVLWAAACAGAAVLIYR
jgi:hypothetical protein